MLHLATPIPMDDDLLMSDDERRAFMTPQPRSYTWFRPTTNATGFRGVTAARSGGRYQANVRFHGRALYLGTFDTSELAARAYDAKVRELRGDVGILNFPEGEAAA